MTQTSMFPEQQHRVHNILDKWSNILSEEDINLALAVYNRSEKLRESTTVYPNSEDVFKIFDLIQPIEVKTVILGQDPYHDGNATGIAFACKKTLSPSLKQIYNAIKTDIPESTYKGDFKVDTRLEHLTAQGVFLLNTLLTVQKNNALSHKYINWGNFTSRVVHHLSRTRSNLVFMLWGSYAQRYKRYIDSKKHLILTNTHPVYATYKGKQWECDHFSKCNTFLEKHDIKTIDWR